MLELVVRVPRLYLPVSIDGWFPGHLSRAEGLCGASPCSRVNDRELASFRLDYILSIFFQISPISFCHTSSYTRR